MDGEAEGVGPGVLLVLLSSDERALVDAALIDGFNVSCSRTMEEALMRLGRESHDAVVLAIGPVSPSTASIVTSLRLRDPLIPLLVLADAANEFDIEALLEAGADDCVVLPARPQFVRTRLRVLLRRTAVLSSRTLTFGDSTIDPRTRTLAGPNAHTALTQREFGVLTYLMSRHSTIVERAELLQRVWGYDFDPGTSVLDVTISRVRRKIEQVGSNVTLRSIRGVGFALESLGTPIVDAL